MKNMLLVMLGGGFGSGLRYWLGIVVKKYLDKNFPLSTWIINVFGCLIIGIIIGQYYKQEAGNESLKLLLTTGFCGGFTTFSAFAFENFRMIEGNNYATALLYIGASLLFGILAVWVGLAIGKI